MVDCVLVEEMDEEFLAEIAVGPARRRATGAHLHPGRGDGARPRDAARRPPPDAPSTLAEPARGWSNPTASLQARASPPAMRSSGSPRRASTATASHWRAAPSGRRAGSWDATSRSLGGRSARSYSNRPPCTSTSPWPCCGSSTCGRSSTSRAAASSTCAASRPRPGSPSRRCRRSPRSSAPSSSSRQARRRHHVRRVQHGRRLLRGRARGGSRARHRDRQGLRH